jgi:hypothetical protein
MRDGKHDVNVYEVNYGETDWFIATTFKELSSIMDDHFGSDLADILSEGISISRLDPKDTIEIRHSDYGCETGEKTVEEWIKLFNGKSQLLCSTLY